MSACVSLLEGQAGMDFWPDAAPLVAKALVRDCEAGLTIEEVGEQIGNGQARLIVVNDGQDILGISVVQLYTVRGERLMHMLTLTGARMPEWIGTYLAEVEDMARANDAVGVTMNGRMGWSKILGRHGYEAEQIRMRKEVS